MNWRCILRHKRKSDYGEFREYCERCGKKFSDQATLLLMQQTLRKWEEYENGEIEEWEVYHFIECMWDEVPWERKYTEESL